jgi:hypothetical protein
MQTTTRRGLIGAFMVSGATLAATRIEATPQHVDFAGLKKDTDIACLYHCDFGDPRRFGQMLTNMNNHLSVYEFDTFKIKLVTVAHGAGIKFFLRDLAGTPWEKDTIDPELYQRVVGLAKFGVEIYLCQITFTRNKIDLGKAKDDPFIKFVPSGVATVGELQHKGYGYLKTG